MDFEEYVSATTAGSDDGDRERDFKSPKRLGTWCSFLLRQEDRPTVLNWTTLCQTTSSTWSFRAKGFMSNAFLRSWTSFIVQILGSRLSRLHQDFSYTSIYDSYLNWNSMLYLNWEQPRFLRVNFEIHIFFFIFKFSTLYLRNRSLTDIFTRVIADIFVVLLVLFGVTSLVDCAYSSVLSDLQKLWHDLQGPAYEL